jgi:hypothetical protein
VALLADNKRPPHGGLVSTEHGFDPGHCLLLDGNTQVPTAEGVQSAFQPLKSNYHNTYKSKIITKDGKLEIVDE